MILPVSNGLEPRIRRASREVCLAELSLFPSGNGRGKDFCCQAINDRLRIEVFDYVLHHKIVDAVSASVRVFDIFAIREHVLLSPPMYKDVAKSPY